MSAPGGVLLTDGCPCMLSRAQRARRRGAVAAQVGIACAPHMEFRNATEDLTMSKRAGKRTGHDAAAPVLLSGGNPQIPKGYGDASVQAYIAAMPGWKRDVGQQLDAIITRVVPNVRKAVKWNSPLYGLDNDTYFLGFHCLTKYVKVAFFRGASLDPLPPGTSRQHCVRYLDIREQTPLNDALFAQWVVQASQLPGERM